MLLTLTLNRAVIINNFIKLEGQSRGSALSVSIFICFYHYIFGAADEYSAFSCYNFYLFFYAESFTKFFRYYNSPEPVYFFFIPVSIFRLIIKIKNTLTSSECH